MSTATTVSERRKRNTRTCTLSPGWDVPLEFRWLRNTAARERQEEGGEDGVFYSF